MISLFKNFKKKSLKAKIGIIAFIVFMIALVSYVIYSNFKPEPPAEYEVSEVVYGSITDTLDVSGTVVSGVSESLTAIEGVFVEEVFVNVGDRVSKGDKLATFNVSGVAKYLTSAEKEYDEALAEYNDSKSASDANATKKAQLEKEIKAKKSEITALEKQIADLQAEIQNAEPVTETQSIPQEQIDAIVEQMRENGATEDQINGFIEAATTTQIPVNSTDTSKAEELTQLNIKLAQLNSELSSLQAESALALTTDEDMLEALKSIADSKKANYENVRAIYNKMKNGWYAENNGIVTVVNIKAGYEFMPVADKNSFDLSALLGNSGVDANSLTSLIGNTTTIPTGTGITIESYDDMVVSVTVGKADLLKIKVGMNAVITSLGSEYDGEVVYVGATAVESTGMDLSSLMGTSSGATGAEVKVKIKNPDEKVVIGFDVDIKIKLSTVDEVLKIPVECVMFENGKYSVFVYDEEKGTIVRRIITKGTLDDASYEIIDGLSNGEWVVKSPDPNMEDGTKIAKKTS